MYALIHLTSCSNLLLLFHVTCPVDIYYIYTLNNLKYACTVSHFSYAPPFQGPHFLTIMLESNILYDNLLMNILSVWWHRIYIEITHSNQSATSNAILIKMLMQLERHYFLFAFCARNNPWWSLWQKNTKNNCFIQVKHPFLVVEDSNTVTFWRNARFDVILTSVTIIKQVFLRKLFCYESLVDIEVSKHKIILSLTRLIALVVVTSSLTSTPWRQLIHLFFYENKQRIHGCLK